MKTNTTTAVALFVGDLSPGGYLLRASFALASVPGSRDSGECQTASSVEPKAAGGTQGRRGEAWAQPLGRPRGARPVKVHLEAATRNGPGWE